MATVKRAQPATHPTVYVGLALATVGLLLAVYAYTGTRIYDVRFALVALAGALLAMGGIFTAAWGRAIATARSARARRETLQKDARAMDPASFAPPPTVAATTEKKRLDLSRWVPRRAKKDPDARPAEAAPARPAKGAGAFAFRRSAPPPPPAPPADEAPRHEAPLPAPVAAADPAPIETAADPAAPPVLERVTVRCPRCATQATFEGVRPLPIQCPSCGLAGTV